MLRIESIHDINRIIEQKYREGNDLYFWTGKVFGDSDADLVRLSKKIAAVANGGGATIIIGIKSLRGRAVAAEPVLKDINIEWLKQEIQSRVKRRLKEFKLRKITDIAGVFLIIEIGENNDAPHMFEDGKYYVWKANKAVLLDEVEVRFMYHAISRPELEFVGLYSTNGLPVLKDGIIEFISFYPKIIVQNRGGAVEKDYKLELVIPAELHDSKFLPLQTYLVRHEGGNMVFSIPGRDPLFQDEISAPFEIKLLVTPDNYTVFEQAQIQIRIYYSKGVNTHVISMADSFHYNGRKLNAADFKRSKSLEN
jgi:hypothetical protein